MSAEAKAAAVGYLRGGWSPIPVKGRSKQTSLTELAPYLRRRATGDEISSWSWPGVGIVTGPVSGVLVLDVDGPEGEAVLKEHGHPITPRFCQLKISKARGRQSPRPLGRGRKLKRRLPSRSPRATSGNDTPSPDGSAPLRGDDAPAENAHKSDRTVLESVAPAPPT